MSKLQNESPCPVCGKTSYSWGRIYPPSLRFAAEDDNSLGNGVRDLMLKQVPARQCDDCGNIQLFSADFVGEK